MYSWEKEGTLGSEPVLWRPFHAVSIGCLFSNNSNNINFNTSVYSIDTVSDPAQRLLHSCIASLVVDFPSKITVLQQFWRYYDIFERKDRTGGPGVAKSLGGGG